ncbi:DUF1329 domain-containing protein [Lysobacter fragariae]
MKLIHITATCAALAAASIASTAVAQNANALGTTLTPVGAQKEGNADGSIPAYDGGLSGRAAQNGKRANPFPDEKPLFSIKGDNVGKYAVKLSVGAQALLKKYPDFRIDVYPTHRTAAFPQVWYDNTKKCATVAKTTDGGLGLDSPQRNCVPFPLPENGYEVMWNHATHYRGASVEALVSNWNVNSAGRASLSATANAKVYGVYHDESPGVNAKLGQQLLVNLLAPARHDGEKILVHEFVNQYRDRRQSWSYLPGQRRVRMAPDIAFDAPNSTTNGTSTIDDTYLFSGSMERYNMKLVGKTEMYVPYNDNQLAYYTPTATSLKPKFINPDSVRWELHRVWVVEATLKPGKRHVYSKRTFYIDEDSWVALASDEYDSRGQLYRVGFTFPVQNSDVPLLYGDVYVHYDLIAGSYSISNLMVGPKEGIWYNRKLPKDLFTPGSLAGSGVR